MMEQSVDTGASVAPMVENKQKSGKGLKITTAIACVAAVCGIGFGVYGMMQSSQKDSQISDLKVQIKEADGTITTIEAPEIETTTDNGTIVTVTDTAKVSGGPYIENGYFYVPKWGAKYKLSDDLTNYGYAVDQESQGDGYGNYVVGLTAISKSDYIEHPQVAYYNDIFSCSVVTIRAVEDSKTGGHNVTPDVQFNGFDFMIHDTWRTRNCTGNIALDPDTNHYYTLDYYAPTETVVEQLKTILLNPEKI